MRFLILLILGTVFLSSCGQGAPDLRSESSTLSSEDSDTDAPEPSNDEPELTASIASCRIIGGTGQIHYERETSEQNCRANCSYFSSSSYRTCEWDDSVFEGQELRQVTGLRFSSAGPIEGKSCLQIKEEAEPSATTWDDNYLCADFDPGWEWSQSGAIPGMWCVQWLEPSDPHTWQDNYLCADYNLQMRFSYIGAYSDQNCTAIYEASDLAGTWDDNFLCEGNYQ